MICRNNWMRLARRNRTMPLDIPVQGELIENAPLGSQSWFRCGGAADALFKPKNVHDLSAFLKAYPYADPLMVLGGMANCIIRDGGVRGVVVQLGKAFADLEIFDGHYIRASAGALNGSVAAAAVKAGIGGLEFLSGIPGSVGGAMAMNAGAYGAEMKDVLIGLTVMDRNGDVRRLSKDDLGMSYRKTIFPSPGIIVIDAVLKGQAEEASVVKERLKAIKQKRNETQPIKEKTGGSTFANPHADELRRSGLPEDTRAWKVVERVGGRGLQIGGAQMSEKHCNFMINVGNATASDLETLGEELRTRAMAEFGLDLHWEIKRIGEKV
jgi:UDP-N-acetylmuramate dehydrogenase